MPSPTPLFPRRPPDDPPDGPPDHRVEAVLEVLGGATNRDVARRWSVDPGLLHRWVRDFVAAGTAQVTNRPAEDTARQRDRFLAAFAHETRSPLAVAQGWVGMLRDGDLTAPEALASVNRLHEALGRLADRTLDVELLAAASLGRLEVRRELVTMADLADGLPGLRLSPGCARQVLDVDPRLFPRILRDLWQAARLEPEPISVRLETRTEDRWSDVRVVREGDPVDHRVLQALFEPFDLNDDGTGVTIGLYLARALAVAHGGTIGVDQDDDGAALWLRVPVPA